MFKFMCRSVLVFVGHRYSLRRSKNVNLRPCSLSGKRAQWYNELFSNCTTNVRLHIKDIGSARPWDWQILINGFIAERAYELKAIDTSLPFAELRRLSYIDYRARAADDDPTFSSLIRKGIPGIP